MMRFFAPVWAALFVLCAAAPPAAAQDSVISGLPAAASLTGAEMAPLDQGSCPGTPPACTTVRASLSQIKTWIAAGTVTSVTVTTPTEISNSGCSITVSGTCALSWASESANKVLAGPTTGSAATPAFRLLVAADIPSLSGSYDAAGAAATAQSTAEAFSANAANLTSGQVATTRGGAGVSNGVFQISMELDNVDLHNGGAPGDVAHFAFPSTVNDYVVNRVYMWNCSGTSGSITSAGWSGAGGTGTAVGTAVTVTTFGSTTITALQVGSINWAASHDLYVNVTSPNSGALTCNLTAVIQVLK